MSNKYEIHEMDIEFMDEAIAKIEYAKSKGFDNLTASNIVVAGLLKETIITLSMNAEELIDNNDVNTEGIILSVDEFIKQAVISGNKIKITNAVDKQLKD